MLELLGERPVMVVAHPDDETLWGGGLAIKADVQAIICCSIPRMDPVRAWLFHKACAYLGTAGFIWPFIESPPTHDLMSLPDLSDFDWATSFITHGADGEYGHRHHKQVHQHVLDEANGVPVATFARQGQYVLALDEEQEEQKMNALKCYNHVMPYMGYRIHKWQALLHRYCDVEGFDFGIEHYDVWLAKELPEDSGDRTELKDA